MNSIFPFTVENDGQHLASEEQLPVFRELAYDYDNNRLLRKGGKPYLIEKDEALKVWIYKALKARRFVWPAYTHGYGNEVEKVVGLSNDPDVIDSEIRRYITEALMVNPYIQELSDFTFRHEGSVVEVEYVVTTIYGRFNYESEVYNE